MLKLSIRFVAAALILAGMYLAAFGNTWGPRVFEVLSRSQTGLWLELIVPFLPIVLIACGAALYAAGKPPERHQ